MKLEVFVLLFKNVNTLFIKLRKIICFYQVTESEETD